GASPIRRDIVINNAPVSGMQFVFPVANVSGFVVAEDGSAVKDVSGAIEISTVSNPNAVLTTTVQIARDGGFGDIFSADEYRFRVSSFPQEYTIRSITAGTRNLLNNNLVVGSVPVLVEIRIAHKNSASGVVRGTAINGTLGGPSSAERVELCCFPTGP